MHDLYQVLATEKASTSVGLKEEMKFWLNQVHTISDSTTNSEVLKAGIMHVKSAVALMNALQNSGPTSTLTPTKKIAPNTNNAIQPRFSSVRKRVRVRMSSLTKPTAIECETCKTKIARIEPEVCAICYKEDDKLDAKESQTVEWIQCTICSTWIHCLCANINNLCNACAK